MLTIDDGIKLTRFQEKVLLVPESYDLFLGGGRGGGKSFALAFLLLRFAEQYRGNGRALFVRRSYPGLRDFESVLRAVFGLAYGRGASYNAADHVWRLPNGCLVELGQLENEGDYQKYQGRSFGLVIVDEAGQYNSPYLPDMLRANLRAANGVTCRYILAANPGGVGHAWLSERFVFTGAAPWTPFVEPKSKRQFVYAPSTYADNEFLNSEEYESQLEAACPHDPELLESWKSGDWSVTRGAYFASVLSEARNALDPLDPKEPLPGPHYAWHKYLSHDFGVSAPSVTFVCAVALDGVLTPDKKYFPKGSLLLLDELATHEPGDLSKGMNYTVPRLAEEIRDLCKTWNMRAHGCADDAIFANMGSGAGSIADEFRSERCFFTRAKKGSRTWGWQKMRQLLANAGRPDVPGLFVSRACSYWWQTVPSLPRDPRKPDDVDSRAPDHGADACRYACLYQPLMPSRQRYWR